MADLEAQLKAAEAAGARFKLVVTDGVFSMDGYIAKLAEICDLAEKHGAMVMVDDSHAVGFMGENGRGTHEHCGVMGRVDIITGTFGKALGGASGGYIAGPAGRHRLAAAEGPPLPLLQLRGPLHRGGHPEGAGPAQGQQGLIQQVHENARYFRAGMEKAGFKLLPGEHPIVPVMLYEAPLAQEFAKRLLDEGRLRHRLLLPRGAQGPGPHPHPDERRPHP